MTLAACGALWLAVIAVTGRADDRCGALLADVVTATSGCQHLAAINADDVAAAAADAGRVQAIVQRHGRQRQHGVLVRPQLDRVCSHQVFTVVDRNLAIEQIKLYATGNHAGWIA